MLEKTKISFCLRAQSVLSRSGCIVAESNMPLEDMLNYWANILEGHKIMNMKKTGMNPKVFKICPRY